MTTPACTPSELLAVMGSRQLQDDTSVFAGVGVPLLAAALAQQRHAPRLTMVIEGGIIGPRIRPGRLPISTNEMGTGGANDIISLCREVIILTAHERRRFVERVDFVTSPGFLEGDGSRARAGLIFGKVSRVVTTLGLFGFDPESKRMRLDALHAGISKDTVVRETGFEVLIPERVDTTPPPEEDELAVLREIDPDRRFLG